jgi:hypothetical protein
LKPTAKFKAPLRGGGICEVKAGKQTSHISQALKTKLTGDYFSKSKWIKSSL